MGPRPGNEGAVFSHLLEERIRAELSQTLGIDKDRVVVDSSVFEGR